MTRTAVEFIEKSFSRAARDDFRVTLNNIISWAIFISKCKINGGSIICFINLLIWVSCGIYLLLVPAPDHHFVL